MKKKAALLLVTAMVAASLTACGASTTASTEATAAPETAVETTAAEEATEAATEVVTEAAAETAEAGVIDLSDVTLMNDGVLTVGVEVGYPPFEDFAEDGTTPIGYDIDIATEVASRLGLEVNFINTAWDGIFAGIDTNYDCVCSAVTINAERKETMSFSTPYIDNYQAVVVPTGSDLAIAGFEDLDGLIVAVQKETTSDELISDYKSTGTINVEIVANEKVTSCFTQVTNGEVDAVVVDSTVADGYVAGNPELYTIIFQDDTEPEEFGIAMGLNNTSLQTAVNAALAAMEADGFIRETYDYWFGSAQ